MRILVGLLLLIGVLSVNAQQRYMSKSAFIKFYSNTPLEKIEAVNNSGACVLDIGTGNVELSLLNTAFQFKKALMQQHFNENYMESPKFPKSKFKGRITDLSKIDFNKAGTYKAEVVGDLTMHGVTQSLTLPANIRIDAGGVIAGEVRFTVKPEDYNIEIPSLVKDNIAKEIEVTVKSDLKKM